VGRVESSGSILKELINRQDNVMDFSNLKYFTGLDVVSFKGHPNVRATHKTTLEITKENYLTPRGDCIIGVSADKGLADLNQELKQIIRSRNSVILILLVDESGEYDLIVGRGDPRLELSDDRRIIIRKSAHVSRNTLAINSTKSAADIKRSLIENLRRGVNARAYIVGLVASASL